MPRHMVIGVEQLQHRRRPMTNDIPHLESKPGLGEECPYVGYALGLSDRGDLEGARDALLCAVDVDFNNAFAWGQLSQVYDEMDEPEHAAEAARQAVRSDPNSPMWHVLRAVKVQALGDNDEALKSFSTALQQDASCAPALFHRASVLSGLGRNDEALADFNEAVKLDPALWDASEQLEEFDTLREHKNFPERPAEKDGGKPFPNGIQPNPFKHLDISFPQE